MSVRAPWVERLGSGISRRTRCFSGLWSEGENVTEVAWGRPTHRGAAGCFSLPLTGVPQTPCPINSWGDHYINT